MKYVSLGRRDRELPMLETGVGNVLDVCFTDLDIDFDDVEIVIKKSQTDETRVKCTPEGGGSWSVYVKPSEFTEVGDFEYRLLAIEPNGGSEFIGVGTVRVNGSVSNSDANMNPNPNGGFGIILTNPNSTISINGSSYVLGTDGKYYKLSVDFDERSGKPYLNLDENGIEIGGVNG